MSAKVYKFSSTSHPKGNYGYKKPKPHSFSLTPKAKPAQGPTKIEWPKNFASKILRD